MAVKIQVDVFQVVMPCIVAVRYQRFGGPCSLHLQSDWSWRQHGPPKHHYPTTTLYGITTQKTLTLWSLNDVHSLCSP